jgi:hypothetical protein
VAPLATSEVSTVTDMHHVNLNESSHHHHVTNQAIASRPLTPELTGMHYITLHAPLTQEW